MILKSADWGAKEDMKFHVSFSPIHEWTTLAERIDEIIIYLNKLRHLQEKISASLNKPGQPECVHYCAW